MNIITLDAETYFSDEFTLSKMSTESYIRDKRFEAHGWAVKWSPDVEPRWYTHDEFVFHAKEVDWSQHALLCHHSQFDGLILAHHYGIRPKFWFDTLSMARLLIGNHLSVALGSLAKHFNLQAKDVPYGLFKGKHWHELSPAVKQQVGDGACLDVSITWNLFLKLIKQMPPEELEIVDATVKMFTEPCLLADLDMLGTLWESEANAKAARQAALDVTPAQLQSAEQFADLLRAEGVEPETKITAKGNEIYAFAKTDAQMRELLEDENPRVQALVEARLGQKSTQLQTRAETLGWMQQRGGNLCVYLRYAGAHTSRWSGGDGCLTEDTRVICFDYERGFAEKRIVAVLPDDLVWDGEEFVHHKGVVFRGEQNIIEYAGIRGTPDHPVFFAPGKSCRLAEAARRGTGIMGCLPPTRRQMESVARGRFDPRVVPLPVRVREKRPPE